MKKEKTVQRHEIVHTFTSDFLYELDELPVEEGITLIQNVIEEFKFENKHKWESFKFESVYNGCDDSRSLFIVARRHETDEEVADREQKEKLRIEASKLHKKERELKEYKRLKKLFEGK